MPHNAIFLIDEICVPHAWYSVEEGINDSFYMHVWNTQTNNRFNVKAKIPAGNYDGPLLQTTLQASLTAVLPSGWGDFTFDYDNSTFSLKLSIGY